MKKLNLKKTIFLSLTIFLVGFQSRFQPEDQTGSQGQSKLQPEDQTEEQGQFKLQPETESKMTRTDIRTCGIVNSEYNLMEGELSDTWAQELIGSDLLRQELEEIPPPSHTNFISVFDSPREDHDYKVRHLISGPANYAVLPELGDKISVFDTSMSRGYHLAVSQLKEDGETPSFINNSQSWIIDDRSTYSIFKSLSPLTLLVISAGNTFPQALEALPSKASIDFNAIIVGSFSPDGFVSGFSQEGAEVWILAPSDNYISSLDSHGEYSQFGGTSGAAPLVTGTLAGFEWISSYHPSAYEAKILLEKTAIKTLHSYENPQRNGVGLLNSYKIAMLGKRLKEKCLSEAQNPFCFKREIQNDENYYFPPDEFLKPAIAEAFPTCAHKLNEDILFSTEPLNATLKDSQNTCAEKKASFLRLRRALFLSPDRRDLWEILSCIYSRAGFSQNSKALDKLGQASELNEENLDVLSLEFKTSLLESIYHPDSEFTRSIMYSYYPEHRFARLMIRLLSESGRTRELEQLFSHEDAYLRLAMIEGAFSLGDKPQINLVNLLEKLEEDENEAIKIRIAKLAREIGGEGNLNLLRLMTQDKNEDVRIMIADGARIIGGEWSLSLLKLMAEDESKYVRAMVADSAHQIGSFDAISLFESICRRKDFGTKQEFSMKVGSFFERVWELCNSHQLLHTDNQ